MWYLSEELVPFSLCDPEMTNEVKEDIADAMITVARPQEFTPEKLEKTSVRSTSCPTASLIGIKVVADFLTSGH